MNNLPFETKCAIIRCLVEGCSIRSTVRITGASKNTIQKLTRELGEACLDHQDKASRLLNCKRIECDEIWNFCYAKDKNLRRYAACSGRRQHVDLDGALQRYEAHYLLAAWKS